MLLNIWTVSHTSIHSIRLVQFFSVSIQKIKKSNYEMSKIYPPPPPNDNLQHHWFQTIMGVQRVIVTFLFNSLLFFLLLVFRLGPWLTLEESPQNTNRSLCTSTASYTCMCDYCERNTFSNWCSQRYCRFCFEKKV